MTDAVTVSFGLNGETRTLTGPPQRRLLDILRETYGLTAAKPGCGIGRCGACLVLLDGRPANACLIMAFALDGVEIHTPEGLDAFPEAEPLRAALIEEAAFQCGYCAPGMTVALLAILHRDPEAGADALRSALEGQLCRCTGYASIIRGAEAAAERIRQLRAAENPGGRRLIESEGQNRVAKL